jgi:hypothetical protein
VHELFTRILYVPTELYVLQRIHDKENIKVQNTIQKSMRLKVTFSSVQLYFTAGVVPFLATCCVEVSLIYKCKNQPIHICTCAAGIMKEKYTI